MEKINNFSTYHDFLKDKIMQFRGSIEDYIYYLPSLFKVLCDSLNDHSLKAQDRSLILCSLGYFVVPNDVIPEEIYGPAGYVDDTFLCAWTLKKIIEKYGIDFLRRYWNDENDPLDEVVEYCLEETSKFLNDKKSEVFEFMGIQGD